MSSIFRYVFPTTSGSFRCILEIDCSSMLKECWDCEVLAEAERCLLVFFFLAIAAERCGRMVEGNDFLPLCFVRPLGLFVGISISSPELVSLKPAVPAETGTSLIFGMKHQWYILITYRRQSLDALISVSRPLDYQMNVFQIISLAAYYFRVQELKLMATFRVLFLLRSKRKTNEQLDRFSL